MLTWQSKHMKKQQKHLIIHFILGITESGTLFAGTVKSAAGLGRIF